MSSEQLEQIRGIAKGIRERLDRDHAIHSLADLACLDDAAVEELQQTLRASRVGRADVGRWRDEARRLTTAQAASADTPRATFVVEARLHPDGTSDQPTFVVHHIEADETLETSGPLPTVDVVAGWMHDRVSRAGTRSEPAQAEKPADERPPAPQNEAPPQPVQRGRLRITDLKVRHAGDGDVHGRAMSLLADVPVIIDGRLPVVLVARVRLEGAAESTTCRMRCRLDHVGSKQAFTFAWGDDMTLTPDNPERETASRPLPIPVGTYRGIVFAEGRSCSARRGFLELPVISFV
jgi:hypothetical protein